MLKNILCTVFSLGLTTAIHAQYLESFDTPDKGYLLNFVDDFSGVNWTLSPWANQPPVAFGRDIADYFQTTAAGKLESIDLDQEVCWESPLINTTAAPVVSLAVDLSWEGFDTDISGNPCTEASLDYIKVQYSVDGGAYTTVPNVAGGNACATVGYVFGAPNPPFSGASTVTMSGIAGGSTLRIRICVNTNSNSEIVTIDNVSVPETGVTLGCTAPDLSTVVTNITCGGPTTGAINLSVAGGTPGYTYAWSNGDPGEDAGSLAEGTYTVTVTDAAGCTATTSATVGLAPFSINTQVGPATCAGLPDGEIDLAVTGGTPPYTYSWSDLPGANDPQDRTGLATGSYSVMVTDSGVCTASTSATVDVATPGPYLETFSLDGKGLLVGSTCPGPDASTCTNNNFAGVNWRIYGLSPLLGIETDDYFSTSGGVLQGKDFDQIICWESPVVDIDPPGTNVAFSVDLGWVGFDQEPPGPMPQDLVADHIDVEYSVDEGAWIRVPNQTGGGLTGHTIVYINGSGANLGGNTTVTATGIAGSALRIRVCGYINSDAEMITIDNVSVPSSTSLYCPLPVLAITNKDATCSGGPDGAIDLTVSGGAPGYTYAWSNGAVTEDLDSLSAGTYTVTVTDNAGYSAVAMATVGEPAAMLLTATVSNPILCFGGSDGALELGIDGGQPLYTVQWSTGANTNPVASLASGVYAATVTDANGCTAELANIQLDDPAPVQGILQPFGPLCPGGELLLALDTIYGGAGAPYLFSVDNGVLYDPKLSISVGDTGIHVVTYYDRLVCEFSDTILVEAAMPSLAAISGQDTACVDMPEGYSLPANFADYQWVASKNGLISLGQGTDAVTVLWATPGANTLTAFFTNASGCPDSALFNLTVEVCVGTQELASGVQVRPNPFSAGLTVQFERPVQPGARVRLTDLQGRILVEQAILQENTTLEVAALPPGLYLLQIVENVRSGIWKVIKGD